jgi:hypothetical protein
MSENPNPRAGQYTHTGMSPAFYDEVVFTSNTTQDILTFMDHSAVNGTVVTGIIEITYTNSNKDTISTVKRTL